jgi:hypothetical protein
MKYQSALSRLKDGELCLITTEQGEQQMRWSVTAWCFFYLERGTPVMCDPNQIQEWRPAPRQ